MYGGFTDTEFLRGGADRGPVLYDVKSKTFSPLLYVFFQTSSLPASSCCILCGRKMRYEKKHKKAGQKLLSGFGFMIGVDSAIWNRG